MVGAIVASVLIVGCGSSSDDNVSVDNSANVEHFTKVIVNGDTMEQDNQRKLQWVGSAGADGNACQANPVADMEVAAVASANDHCNALVFAGHDDWRAPTAVEQSDMIKDMRAAGQTPFYTVPSCPRLMGVDGSIATAVNTHNLEPVGALTSWSDLLDLPTTNYGVKCVRAF